MPNGFGAVARRYDAFEATPDVTCPDATRYDALEVSENLEGLVPFEAWGFKSPLRHERMFDRVPEVSMRLGFFRVKNRNRESFRESSREYP